MHDVIVVGAGPAGGSAAYHCARAGLSTLLLEKEELPRDKPCGGMLSPRYIERLGLGDAVEVRAARCRMLVNCEDIGSREAEACLVDRARFDGALAEKARAAGAELLTGRRVTGLRRGGAITVECGPEVFEAKVVIGADGVNSPVRRLAGMEEARRRPDRIVSLVTEIPLSQADIDTVLSNHGTSYFDINFTTFFPGYTWIFPKRGRLNVGIGAIASHGGDIRSGLDAFMMNMGLGGLDPHNVKGALIPCRPLSRFRSDRVLLVGDAAGLVDPFTGGGIDKAMASGEMAAKACAAAVAGNDLRLLSKYDRAIAPLARSLRTRTRLVNLAAKLMDNGLDSPGADRAVLGLFNRLV